ncbi:hypothetical protein PC116_g29983, partial [Phytophthora cactorum]
MAPPRLIFALLIARFTATAAISTSRTPSLGSGTVPTEPTSSFDSSLSARNSAIEFATPATAKSTVVSTYRNWVGTWSMSQDTACYLEAHFMDVCPSNYDRNEFTNTCWTECPMDYPVECGMECIRQNDDCGIEVASKVSAVAITIVRSASFGVFGALEMLGQKVWWAARCTNATLLVMRGILRYIRTMKAEDPQATDRKLVVLLFQTSTVVTDLPIAIAVCTRKPVSPNLRQSQHVLSTAQWMLMQALAHDDSIISSWQRFRAFLEGANFTEATEKITEGEIASLETAMKQDSSCGGDLKFLIDRVWLTMNEYREDNPAITDDEIRLKISDSDLVLYDVPIVTNNCMQQMISESSLATAYKTREVLRKTFGVIMN